MRLLFDECVMGQTGRRKIHDVFHQPECEPRYRGADVMDLLAADHGYSLAAR